MNNSNKAKIDFTSNLSFLTEIIKVEALISSKIKSDASSLEEISNYLLSIGGKRIRPILSLLLFKLFNDKINDQILTISAGIELIHMATLLHDDIIDKSFIRRHHPSPFCIYGQDKTLLTGDFLLVQAFSLCSELNSSIVKKTSFYCTHLTEGEILESNLYTYKPDFDEYLNIIIKKTAALFKLAAFSAGNLSNFSIEDNIYLESFGENLGISFQIIDDILDLFSSEKELGKKIGQDLIEKKPSILNIYWLESKSTLAKNLLDEAFIVDQKFIREAKKEMIDLGVYDKALNYAKLSIENCINDFNQVTKNKKLNDKPYKAIQSLFGYMLTRIS